MKVNELKVTFDSSSSSRDTLPVNQHIPLLRSVD